MNTRFGLTLLGELLAGFRAAAQTPLHLGFLQPADSKATGPHHAAAPAFAEKIGSVMRLHPAKDTGWQVATGARTRLDGCAGAITGKRCNAAAIEFINLIYNMARHEHIVRLQLIPVRAT